MNKDIQVFFKLEKKGMPTRIEDVIVTVMESDQIEANDLKENPIIVGEGLKQLAIKKQLDQEESITFLKMQPYDWRVGYLA